MSKNNLSILLIEDSPSDIDLLQEMLEGDSMQFTVIVAEQLSDGLDYLSSHSIDLILLDLSLPDSQGLETFNRMRAAAVTTPIIVMTGMDDETLALKAVSLGAQDYLIKGDVGSNLLIRSIRYAIERNRLSNTLYDQEKKFKTLVDNTPDVISRVDRDLRRVYVNPAIEAATGIPSSLHIGKTYQELGLSSTKLSDAVPLWEAAIRTVFQSGQQQTIETRLPSPSGWRYYQTRIVPEFAPDGSIPTVLSIARDITDRKLMELALQDSDERYRALFERSLDAVFIHDFVGHFIDANTATLNLLGYTRDELIHLDFQSLLSDETVAFQTLQEIQETGIQSEVREFKLKGKEGHDIYVETMSSLIFREGKAWAIQGIARDITARKQTEEALRESERFARSVVDALSAHIAILDETGQIMAVNRGWREFAAANSSLQSSVMEGANYLQVCETAMGPDADEAAPFAAGIRAVIQDTQDVFSLEYPCHSPTEKRWFEGCVTRFPGEGPIRMVVTHENITTRKLAQEAERQYRMRERLLQHAAVISNESDSVDNAFQFVIAKICEYTGWPIGHAYLYDELTPNQLTPTTLWHITDPERFEIFRQDTELNGWIPTTGNVFLREVFKSRKPFWIKDVSTKSDLVRLKTAQLCGIHSAFAFPILIGHHVAAILEFFTTDMIEADGELLNIMVSIGTQLGRVIERQKAEQALRASEERFRGLIQNSADIISIFDPQGIMSFHSPAIQDVLGYSPDAITGLSIFQIVHPEDIDLVEASLNQLVGRYVNASSIEIRLRHHNGSWCMLEAVMTNQLDNPVINGIVVNSRDITTRKKTERELTALYNATSYLFKSDSLPNLGHQIVQAIVKEFGHEDCRLLLKNKANDRLVELASAHKQISAGKILSLDSIGLIQDAARTGKPLYVPDMSVSPDYNSDASNIRSELVIPLHSINGLIGVLDLQSTKTHAFDEVNQRILSAFIERVSALVLTMQLYEEINQYAAELEARVAERTAQLQRSKDRVEAILNHSSDVILLIDPDGHIQQVNYTFYQQFGYQFGEEYRKPLLTLAHSDYTKAVVDNLDDVLQRNQPHRLECIVHRKDGTSFDVDMAMSPILDSNGKIIGVICSLRDISAQKQLEQSLRAALIKEKQLNELKTRFVSMISHEFRTPLTTILSSTDILALYYERIDPTDRLKHFDKIRSQVQRMVRLVNDVLTIGKSDAGAMPFNPLPLSLHQFCQNIAEELQSDPNIKHKLVYSCFDEPTKVLVDEKLLHHAVINLLTNAIKYSSEGSTIEFDLSFDENNAFIRIKDSGIGIPEADLPRLFENFHRASNVGTIQGTGLGLAIVKRAIDAHSGKIDIESEADVGTTFTISLPLNRT